MSAKAEDFMSYDAVGFRMPIEKALTLPLLGILMADEAVDIQESSQISQPPRQELSKAAEHLFQSEIDETYLEHVLKGSSAKLLDKEGNIITDEDGKPINITSGNINNYYPQYAETLLSPKGIPMGFDLGSINAARTTHPEERGQLTLWELNDPYKALLRDKGISPVMMLSPIDEKTGKNYAIRIMFTDQQGNRIRTGVDKILGNLTKNPVYNSILGEPQIFQGFVSYGVQEPGVVPSQQAA